VDAALILRAITTGGYLDRSAKKALIPFTFRGVNEIRQRPKKTFHLGIPSDYFWDRVDGEVRKIAMDALEKKNRASFVLHESRASWVHEWTDPSTNIALADAADFHMRSGWFPARAAEYGDDVRTRLEMGLQIRAVDYLAALDMRTMAWLGLFGQTAGGALLDALVVPTTPFAATEIGMEEVSTNGETEKIRAGLLRLNRPANFAGLPSISIPCGFTSSGLPVGLQIIGQSWQEKSILRIAHTFERSHDDHLRRPPLAV
jgi:aspartyl-tRNA(Asn)/glutamyl-tRNA(Gln) amidotransferase subunit A